MLGVTGAAGAVAVDARADLEGVLADWRAFRQRKRVREVHWIDALYQAYLTALVSGALFLVAASFAGDGPAELDSVTRARAAIGAVAAAAAFLGLRSGSRGGPLALEAAEVRVVLTSPVARVHALRAPVLRQLRFLVFAAAVAGAAAGNLAARRLPGNDLEWVVSGAVAAAVAVSLAHGLACCVAGRRLGAPIATAVALGLLTWSIADAAGRLPGSPFSAVGSIALWPIEPHPAGLAAVPAAAFVVAAGLLLIGGVSLERLERRSRLVGEIRFAATLQDLRTVIVLRRQLTQERSRTQPWLRLRLPRRTPPVLARDIRSLLRWPAVRLVRIVVLAILAGLAARAAYDGSTPLVVVAGIALFLAGLDAAEPLGQEVDHPSRRDSVPVPAGHLYLRHLPVVVVTTMVTAAVAAAAAVLVDPARGGVAVAAACVVPAALGAAAGAVVNVLMGSPDPAGSASGAWAVAPPEAAGMRLLFRLVWPPALATFGVLPVLVAREALQDGRSPASAALAGLPPGIGLVALVAGWARYRQDIATWWAAVIGQAVPDRTRGPRTDG